MHLIPLFTSVETKTFPLSELKPFVRVHWWQMGFSGTKAPIITPRLTHSTTFVFIWNICVNPEHLCTFAVFETYEYIQNM